MPADGGSSVACIQPPSSNPIPRNANFHEPISRRPPSSKTPDSIQQPIDQLLRLFHLRRRFPRLNPRCCGFIASPAPRPRDDTAFRPEILTAVVAVSWRGDRLSSL